MKAVIYNGPYDVSVTEVVDPIIEHPRDAIIKITSTNICGSDLHMYDGRTNFETGRVFGHENMGEVVELGSAVDFLKKGDYVSVPFNVSCGLCANCEKGLTAFCLTTNKPGFAGAAFGFALMGPWQGGQADYLRVPYADFMCLKLPVDVHEKSSDYTMLSDIFPTGWHAVTLSGLQPGETIAIYGSGPVGLMAAHSAMIKGAAQVFVVDEHADRLKKAAEFGAIPINMSHSDPVQQILDLTDGKGTDRGCDCVGFQCCDYTGKEHNNAVMNYLVHSTKFTGGIGCVGVYVPTDPKNPTDNIEKQGQMVFDYGLLWTKGQHIGTGQCNVKKYNRALMNLIHNNKANPGKIVTHNLPLEKAPEAYQHFNARDEGWIKVVLHPQT